MNNLIIALRKWNLRWVIVLVLAIMIINKCFYALNMQSGDRLSALSTLTYVGLAAFLLFIVAWCAQAITDIKKASIVIGAISVATVINFIGQMNGFDSLAPKIQQLVIASMFGDSEAESKMAVLLLANSYQTSLLLYIVSAVAFVYSFNKVYSRYRVCWILMILAFIIDIVGLLMFVTTAQDAFVYVVSFALQSIASVLSLIVYIVLLFLGNNKNFRIVNEVSDPSDTK